MENIIIIINKKKKKRKNNKKFNNLYTRLFSTDLPTESSKSVVSIVDQPPRNVNSPSTVVYANINVQSESSKC